MSSTLVAPGLFAWTLELENGETRTVMAPSLGAAIWGSLPAAVIRAERGDAIDPAAPAPSITALVPASAPIGAPNFTLHVQGTGFAATSVIVFNGFDEPTTFVSATEVTTGVNMDVWTAPSLPLPVLVRTNGQESNAVPFTFVAAPPPEGGEGGR
jgi:hypothetical protein